MPLPQIVSAPVGKGLMNLYPHPAGIEALVAQQLARAQAAFPTPLPDAQGKTALVVGSTSLGYGLSTALAARAAGFKVIGLGLENPPQFRDDKIRAAGAGWYVTAAAHKLGVFERTYFADCFADATKSRVIEDLLSSGTKLDAVFYSVASPVRTHLGTTWRSKLSVKGEPLHTVGMAYDTGRLSPTIIPSATDEEVEATVRVMGGYDIQLLYNMLSSAGLFNEGALMAAYSYIGPQDSEENVRTYRKGPIGFAKEHVEAMMQQLSDQLLLAVGGRAFAVMDPAVVTTASAAIPSVLKYLSAYLAIAGGELVYLDPLDVKIQMIRDLFGGDEAAIQYRLDLDHGLGRLRYDDKELDPRVQAAIREVMMQNASPGEPTASLRRGLEKFRLTYDTLFGFNVPRVDYQAPTSFDVANTPATGVVNLIAPSLRPLTTPVALLSAAEYLKTLPLLPEEPAPAPVDPIADFFRELFEKNDKAGIVVTEDGEGSRKKTIYSFEKPRSMSRESVIAYNRVIGREDLETVSAEQLFAEEYDLIFATLRSDLEARMQDGKSVSVIHVAEQPKLKSDVPVGEELEHRAWVLKKSSQANGSMYIIDREVRHNGQSLGTMRTILLVGVDLSSMSPSITDANVLNGTPLGGFTFTQDTIDAFADVSGDHNLPHTVTGAASLGLRLPVAHGMFNLARANQDGDKDYKAAFKYPVYAGETVLYYADEAGKITGVKKGADDQWITVIELT